MDRQAFRNRMKQLKQYREQNPGKTYLDFKKYAEGGEIPPSNKPIIPEEPQPYKGKLYKDRYGRKYTEDQMNEYYDSSTDEIDRFTGKPFIRGLKPVGDIEDVANATPVGDAISAYDTYKALKNKDWEGAGLAAMGLIPFMPMTVKQFRSSYRGTKPKIKRPTPTVKKDAIQKAIDQYLEGSLKEADPTSIDSRRRYLRSGTEQKAYMNTLRRRMLNDGTIKNIDDQVYTKLLNNYIDQLSDSVITYSDYIKKAYKEHKKYQLIH